MKTPNKILIIRFSSIGDIVLTTPIVRCLSKQLPNAKIHYVTKKIFETVLTHNPYINYLHVFNNDVKEIYDELKKENFDCVIDLHNNLRSARLKFILNKPSYTFKKINLKKFLAVSFKNKSILPKLHIVNRYFEPVKKLGVFNDNKGLDYFISKNDEVNCDSIFFDSIPTVFVALVLGGSYYTKQIPINKLSEICNNLKQPIVLLGGKNEEALGLSLSKKYNHVINTCGLYTLNQSASIIKQSSFIITSDTGLMHIASAFNKIIYSVWGNTIPEFGMSPYLPNPENKILEVSNLSCRPCSKLGHKACPKKHFRCMNEIDFRFLENK